MQDTSLAIDDDLVLTEEEVDIINNSINGDEVGNKFLV